MAQIRGDAREILHLVVALLFCPVDESARPVLRDSYARVVTQVVSAYFGSLRLELESVDLVGSDLARRRLRARICRAHGSRPRPLDATERLRRIHSRMIVADRAAYRLSATASKLLGDRVGDADFIDWDSARSPRQICEPWCHSFAPDIRRKHPL